MSTTRTEELPAGIPGLATTPSRDWQHRADCVNADPELFYPIGTGEYATRQITEAKRWCWGGCPAQPECLAWALITRTMHGVWGGLSEDERIRLQRALSGGHLDRAARIIASAHPVHQSTERSQP